MSSLTLAHTRYLMIEQLRVPIGLVASAFFPAVSMLAFVIPFAGDDPAAATRATGSMMLLGALSSAVISLSITVSQDREQPWNPYLRTLPAGPLPRFAGRILSSLAGMWLSVIPVVVIALAFSEARLTPATLGLALLTLVAASLPFMLLGLFVGFMMSSKAAIAVSQVAFFPLAILGGILLPIQAMPGFVQTLSLYLPSRGSGELMWWAIAGISPDPVALASLAVWTVVIAALAVWAYRRDEGRRFS
ncbi:ABC transporter permease [Nonomuraea typhae]|uniref:ABC transporter permease n=1 Tax=Nonomuraea typhae TaxID=2603600 RepID=UPI0012FBD094|nr:ABC transporter permease [Nonomuraea typhae]